MKVKITLQVYDDEYEQINQKETMQVDVIKEQVLYKIHEASHDIIDTVFEEEKDAGIEHSDELLKKIFR